MERKIYHSLLKWKSRIGRKPLIIRGARQTGKTWIMQEFGRREYENVLYVNFDLDKRLSNIFEEDYELQGPGMDDKLSAICGGIYLVHY
ncbi:MAG: AAA family ATPase [Bacteroidales bacterium]|nr:AAA family ATPase [Bacteroidales bacterium]